MRSEVSGTSQDSSRGIRGSNWYCGWDGGQWSPGPAGACLDLVQFIKGGFGLAESPRLWFKKLQRTVKSMGAREWALIPGIFSFFHEGKVIAMTPA